MNILKKKQNYLNIQILYNYLKLINIIDTNSKDSVS
jgi:hypothetical protein